MAVNEPRLFSPHLPAPPERGQIRFHFDRLSDSLAVFFHGRPQRPTVIVPGNEYESYSVDVETEVVVGFLIEDLLGHAVYQNTYYLEYAALAGVNREELAALRERIEAAWHHESEDSQRQRLVQNWFATVQMGQMIR